MKKIVVPFVLGAVIGLLMMSTLVANPESIIGVESSPYYAMLWLPTIAISEYIVNHSVIAALVIQCVLLTLELGLLGVIIDWAPRQMHRVTALLSGSLGMLIFAILIWGYRAEPSQYLSLVYFPIFPHQADAIGTELAIEGWRARVVCSLVFWELAAAFEFILAAAVYLWLQKNWRAKWERLAHANGW